MAGDDMIYEFGDFRLDVNRRTLLRGETNLSATKKMFDILWMLIENADRVVEKKELMERVWHDRFVEENNLTYNIRMIRRVLGDSAANPTYIETVPRHGYRFIAEVRQGNGAPEIRPTPEAVSKSRNELLERPVADHSYGSRVLTALVVILLTIGLGLILIERPLGLFNSDNVLFANGFQSRKISGSGKAHHSVVSPDGKYVAYTNIVNGKESLWLQHLETANNTLIVPPDDDVYAGLLFSRSGDTLFFARRERTQQRGATIYRMPVFGGPPTRIVDDAEGWLSMSPDDRHISFVRSEHINGTASRVMMIDVDGTNEREISVTYSPNLFWAQAFSPDGKKVAAVLGHSSDAAHNMGIVEIDVETGEQRELITEKFFHIKDVEWLPDMRGVIFSADKDLGEPVRIWQLDRETLKVQMLTDDLLDHGTLSLSADAGQLVATIFAPDFHLLIQDPNNPDAFKMLTQARHRFSFTPDGRIVYASNSAGNDDIWIMNVDGSNQRQLTNARGMDLDPIVSPDGEFVYFSSNRSGANEIWRMKIDGSDPSQITRNGGGYSRFVTPDGKYIFYESSIGRSLRKIASDGTGDELVSDSVGYDKAFSPQGDRLAFLDQASDGAYVMTVIATDTKSILQRFDFPFAGRKPSHIRWMDEDNLAYVMRTDLGLAVWTQNLDGSTARVLHDLEGDGGITDIQFLPAGDRVAIIRGTWKHDAVLLTASKPRYGLTF